MRQIAEFFSVTDFRDKVEKQMFDRDYSAQDIWANYGYFLDAVLPVAEKAGIKLAHHPDDPPITPMNGVAKVFVIYAGYKHAEDVVSKGSKNWGLCLCLGTWLEGGDTMGKDAAAMIKEFGSRDKLFTIHFRNVSSPLPRFHETFQDDGYQDMYLLMKALREVRSTASLIPDHYPGIVSDANLRIEMRIWFLRCGRCCAVLMRKSDEAGAEDAAKKNRRYEMKNVPRGLKSACENSISRLSRRDG